MKKKLVSILLVMAVLLNIFACSTSKNEVVVEKETVQIEESKDLQAENGALKVSEVSSELKKVYADKFIGFTSVKNPRDLGGYKTKDGKTVKSKLLLRGGHLAKISDEEIDKFINDYNLKEIVDFRTNAEIGHSVDKEINGATYHKIDIIKEVEGDDPVVTNMKPVTGDNSADMMVSYYKYKGNIDDMYDEIVNSETSHKGYRQFFDILLNNDGATFFHCSSGKDRTGFAAVFILSILGVDMKTIIDDYEASNVFYEKNMNAVLKPLKENGYSDTDINEIVKLIGVDRLAMEHALDVIDKNYGGMDKYLHNQIGLTDEEMDALRNKYLE